MKAIVLAAAAAFALAAPAVAADAELERMAREQTERLNRWSQERGEALPPGPPLPRPGPPAAPERIEPTLRLLVCISVRVDTPVHAAPDPRSQVIGLSGLVMAMEEVREPTNGFVPVRFGAGERGWIETEKAFRYTPPASDPALRCTVAGIRPNGEAVFRIAR